MNISLAQFDIDPTLLIRYLQNRGWNSLSLKGGLRQLTTDSGHVEIFLNENSYTRSRPDDIYFALRTVSDYYEDEIENVLRDVLSHLSDRIESKIPDQYVSNSSIEFRIAADYLVGMKKLISSSATTEITKSRHFQRTLKEAIAFSDRCRFGHTFRGSFGFVVESPLGPNDNPAFEIVESETPLARRVVERLAKGLHHIALATVARNPVRILEKNSGISSNMCEAVIEILEETSVSNISFNIHFSPEWKTDLQFDSAKRLDISKDSIALLKEAAEELKEKSETGHEKIIGRIRGVGTDGIPANLFDDESKREIEINWIASDDRIVHVKVLVSPADYLIALDAHKSGQFVSVSGILPTAGKTRWLTSYEGFRILET